MWRDNIEIRVVLEVQTLGTGDNLSKQDIRHFMVDVLHACRSRNASINRANREAAL